jgi:transposase
MSYASDRRRLKMRPVGSGERLERRRQRAIELLEEGLAPVEVARLVRVDRRSVRRWNAAYRKQGPSGLTARPVPGRPWKLSVRQREQLEAILVRGASASGYESDLWTCPRVAQVIGQRFRIRYHVAHIGRLLRSLGWTPQRPTRRALERDEEGIQRWSKREWLQIKKKPGT